MSSLTLRYFILIGGLAALFSGFVACGSQFYKVSLVEDSHSRPVSGSGASGAQNEEPTTDPGSAFYGLHSPEGWTGNLPIHFRVDYTITSEQKQGLVTAMHIWEQAVGRQLFTFDGIHTGVTGDTFKDLYSSLDDGINGHYFDDNWGKTGKPTVVLATTIWDNDSVDVKRITTADIHFNRQYYVIGDSLTEKAVGQREVVDMETLALHELGHFLGLTHIPPTVDPQSIMTPSLFIGEGLSNRHLSRGDIERIQKIYGCQGDACDIDKTLDAIDALSREKVETGTLAATTH